MNEEVLQEEVQETSEQSLSYETIIQEVVIKFNEKLDSINNNLTDLNSFFITEKELKLQDEKLAQENEQEELKVQEELNAKLEEEKKEQQEKQDEFYGNISTLVNNTDSVTIQENQEILVSAIQDLNTLTQVNIMSFGLLIGIVIISLLSKFFKK